DDAGRVGEPAEDGGAKAAHAEREAEEESRDQADAARHQLLRVDDDGGEGRREDQADDDREDLRPEQVRVWQREREREHAEDRNPDHELPAEAVADRAAKDGAGGDGAQENKEIDL